jgi:class 3 adenylate cyclase
MIHIGVANKVGRAHFEHGPGPLEFGRGPRREVPRWTIQDPLASNDQLRIEDYIGDGLLAMWNASIKQFQHTVWACRAALSMLAELPRLNARWRDRSGGSLGLGIGLNTGSALVGNTSSLSKLKYGPYGHTVNGK